MASHAAPTAPTWPPGGAGHHRSPLRRRRVDGPIMGVLLLVFGTGWLMRESGVINLSWETLLSVVLVLLGVGMVVTARAKAGGMMFLGIMLTLILASTSSISIDHMQRVRAAGDGAVSVRTIDDIDDLNGDYHLGAGVLRIDLSNLTLPADGAPREISANVGLGELWVQLPRDLPVEVEANVGVGEIDLPSGHRGGLGHHIRYRTHEGKDPVLTIRVSVGAGELHVKEASALG